MRPKTIWDAFFDGFGPGAILGARDRNAPTSLFEPDRGPFSSGPELLSDELVAALAELAEKDRRQQLTLARMELLCGIVVIVTLLGACVTLFLAGHLAAATSLVGAACLITFVSLFLNKRARA